MPRPKAIQFLLQGEGNQTLEGTLILDELPEELSTVEPTMEPYDQQGASAYAIVVIMVYGFSIVLLIASHIFLKKKEDKRDGDEQQIDKYLQQVPDLKEKSKRESFRRLKKSIIPLVSIGMGHDLSALTQSPGCAVPTPLFDDSELGNARRSSYENDPNRPLLDWIKRETARRASIVPETLLLQANETDTPTVNACYTHDAEEPPPSPTTPGSMPIIIEECSDDTDSKRNSVLYLTPGQDSPGHNRRQGVINYTSNAPRGYIEDLWEAQTPKSMSPDRSPQLSRTHDEVFHTPCIELPSPSPSPPLCLVLDASPRKPRPGNRDAPQRSPILPRFQRPKSPVRHQVVSGPTSPETEDMVQVTCV